MRAQLRSDVLSVGGTDTVAIRASGTLELAQMSGAADRERRLALPEAASRPASCQRVVSPFARKSLGVLLLASVSLGLPLFLVLFRGRSSEPTVSTATNSRINPELAAQVAKIEAREQRLAETV